MRTPYDGLSKNIAWFKTDDVLNADNRDSQRNQLSCLRRILQGSSMARIGNPHRGNLGQNSTDMLSKNAPVPARTSSWTVIDSSS